MTSKVIIRLAATVGVVLSGVLALFLYFRPDKTTNLPVDMPSTLYLGTGKPGEVLKSEFILGNNSKAPLQFDIKSSCGCQSIEPSTGVLERGKSVTIHVTMKLTKWGENKTSTIIVTSNNRSQSYIQAIGVCPQPIRITPSTIDFGGIDAYSTKSIEVNITNSSGAAIAKDNIILECDQCSLTEIGDGKYSVTLKKLTKDSVTGLLRIKTDTLEYYDVPISGYLAKQFITIPTRLRKNSEKNDYSVILWRRSTLPIESISIVNSESFEIKKITRNGYKVVCDVTAIPTADSDAIVFALDGDKHVISFVKNELGKNP